MPDLLGVLRKRIGENGPITLADYMETALGHPRFGYYATRDPFGAAGDFTTAPEVSQIFGELIGLWAVCVWQDMGAPRPLRLIELGPGRGTLMADALRAARTAPAFPEAARVDLIETSPVLRAHQERTLRDRCPACAPQWYERLEDVPAGPGLVIANEFFDALPVHQYERREQGWAERLVGLDEEGALAFEASAPLSDDTIVPERFRAAPIGSVFETCPAAANLIHTLGARLREAGGACLIVDYGHGASGLGDTVQSVKAQRYHDVLRDPGAADITAHVDFQALAETAKREGLKTFGPITQRMFLQRVGIRLRAEKLKESGTPDRAKDIDAAVERLIGGHEMGTLFKVLALTDSAASMPPGFE